MTARVTELDPLEQKPINPPTAEIRPNPENPHTLDFFTTTEPENYQGMASNLQGVDPLTKDSRV